MTHQLPTRRRMYRTPIRLAFIVSLIWGCGRTQASDSAAWPAIPDSTFGRLVAGFSEPERYFDTDNLISNEASYLEVVDALPGYGIIGGAYLGVGPDQNFSYIAHVQPKVAFIVDIRRDNLLQHLWYKALFELSASRIEFLSLLYGKPAPARPDEWGSLPLATLLDYIDRAPSDPGQVQAAIDSTMAMVERFTVSLTPAELSAIRTIHARFVLAGLDLRFTTYGRRPRPCYPTHRDLLIDGGAADGPASFLASADAYRFVRNLQQRNLVIPVVGDLAGSHTLVAIGEYLDSRHEAVSAFYTSNVEFYLVEDGIFDRFVINLDELPTDTTSVIIRSVFRRGPLVSPNALCSYQTLQRIEALVTDESHGGYVSYLDLVTRQPLTLP